MVQAHGNYKIQRVLALLFSNNRDEGYSRGLKKFLECYGLLLYSIFEKDMV